MGDRAALLAHRGDAQFVPEQGAVLAVVTQHHRGLAALAHGRAQRLERRLGMVVTLQHAAILADDVLGRVPGHAGKGRVDVVDDIALGRGGGNDDGIHARMDGAALQPQALLRRLSGRNVLDGTEHAGDLVVLAVQRQLVDHVVAQHAVGIDQLVFPVDDRHAGAHDLRLLGHDARLVVRPRKVGIALADDLLRTGQPRNVRKHVVAAGVAVVGVLPEYLVRQGVDQAPVHLLGVVQGAFGTQYIAHVVGEHEAAGLAPVAHCMRRHLDIEAAAVLAAVAPH